MTTRSYILDTLEQVFAKDGYASLLMRHAPAGTDMAFASEVIFGTIRNYSLLEAQWRPYAKRTKLRTALLLDMSVYQLFFLDGTPDYAAVHEAVELAGKHEKGFVNAVLHKVREQGLQVPEDPAVRYSLPSWILNLWKAHYGEETALKIAESCGRRGRITGRVNTLKASKKDFENDPHYTFLDEEAFIYEGPLQNTEEFRNGLVLIQDLHSMQVVKMLKAEEGMHVLDACAAPGTKTQQIACTMNDRGEITAQELYEKRTGLISELMERTGASCVKAVTADATAAGAYPEESFDRILIDAPCSGLGDLSHKPEIRWHLKPENLDELTAIQKAILNANAPYLKHGGILVYSTCTLNKKENENMVRDFLKEHEEYELLEEKTLFPFEDDADGFFAARMRRK